jgi:hypothetical protein
MSVPRHALYGSGGTTQRLADGNAFGEGMPAVVDSSGSVSHVSIFSIDEDGNLI